ncbi:ATP phosphoribosyltransferase regulatory subunit [Phenylobacterium sp.]|uniref:ATP phosphoribosyltransferase regulatory subunit n=1 Tax=Phenylobacterium sp. TaxID=1871053 RepID=UPI0026035ED6|nr:ATP phosphoribosyltransferase regulatory subunit [Phenylobacterium sp.]
MRVEPAVSGEARAAIREALLTGGAEPADAPLLQPLGLLLDLAGEAMRARLFVVQAEGGAEMCLRPDFTVAVARQHIERGALSGRYYYEGAAFRAAPGSDRPEEFLQMGVEVFAPAEGSPARADAEIAQIAWQAARAGGRGDLTLWLGDVGLFGPFIDSLGMSGALAGRLKRVAGRPRLLAAELARAGRESAAPGAEGALAARLAGLPQAEAAALLEEVWSLAGIEPVGGRGPGEIAALLVRKADAARAAALKADQAGAISAFMAISDAPEPALAKVRALAGRKAGMLDAALETWRARLERLAQVAPADHMRFAPALGHAFDYYDGLTFEVRSAALGEDRPIAVGGRYDSLLARLGARADAGAVGCVVRPWRAYVEGEA